MLVTELGITVFIHPAIKALVLVSIIALQLFRESYLEFSLSTIIEVRPVQSRKAALPMLVTELGMVTEVRPVQISKALFPMLITELGMVTEVRLVHQ